MPFLRVLALCPALLVATLALAAETVFPPGSRIGLVPPVGMEVSKRFAGFESTRGAAITVFEMPPGAAAQVIAGLTPTALKAQNITFKGREDLKIGEADAILVAGEESIGGAMVNKWILVAAEPSLTAFVIAQEITGKEAYSDAVMRSALRSVALRQPLPLEDQIAALPFTVGDRAGFTPARAAGSSLLLTEGGAEGGVATGQAMLILAQSADRGPNPEQRDAFASAMLRTNTTLKDLIFERAQGFRQKGADWHEIVARGKDAATGKPVVVMQTVRWGRTSFLRMLGVAPEEDRESRLARFRTVVDSISAE